MRKWLVWSLWLAACAAAALSLHWVSREAGITGGVLAGSLLLGVSLVIGTQLRSHRIACTAVAVVGALCGVTSGLTTRAALDAGCDRQLATADALARTGSATATSAYVSAARRCAPLGRTEAVARARRGVSGR